MSWQPLLNGELKDEARECVRAIVDDLAAYWRDPAGEPSLADGHAGWAILCASLAQCDHGHRHLHIAQGCIERAVAATQKNPSTAALYGGLTGLGWAVAYLRESLPDLDSEDILTEIDDGLLSHLEEAHWSGDYDLISGLVGYAVYALERLPSPAGAACIERVIDHLEQTAEHRAEGLTWWTNPKWLPDETRERWPRGYYNLGLAHGVPGVIAVLAQICAAGARVDQARPLLDGAVRWLLANQNSDGFAHWIDADPAHKPARLAWCYGDPGVAAALLGAASAVNELAWEREALAIALRAARRPPEQSGVKDAGLCHGAAGLGHLFNRMYQATGDSRLAEAARDWFQRALAMRHPGRGVGGFESWSPDGSGSDTWIADSGFLTGSAGIALALLAATTPVEPAWDSILLTAIPPACASEKMSRFAGPKGR
jgi:lantibiotic modifying enzyme